MENKNAWMELNISSECVGELEEQFPKHKKHIKEIAFAYFLRGCLETKKITPELISDVLKYYKKEAKQNG